MRTRRIALAVLALAVLIVAALALGSSARNRANPPVLAEPAWDAPETRQLAVRACFDCHSNETRWPLYSALPIVGGLIADHVTEGRRHLNLSEWGAPGREREDGEEAAEKVYEPMHYAEDDPFPQPPYSLLHPSARLSDAELDRLARGLIASLGGEEGDREGRYDDDDRSAASAARGNGEEHENGD